MKIVVAMKLVFDEKNEKTKLEQGVRVQSETNVWKTSITKDQYR